MTDRKYCEMISRSKPGPGDGGKTGSWRVLRPIINNEKCIPVKAKKKACFNCWLYCPDCVVTKTIPPTINLEYCKGCGICAEECPASAIEMVDEARFIVKEK
ncbi:MAG: 4Fe-4S binding protein [Desulfocapsaceae bacterium]